MLVLSRKRGEKVFIGKVGEIIVTIMDTNMGRVRIGIEAPKDTPIMRGELLNQPKLSEKT